MKKAKRVPLYFINLHLIFVESSKTSLIMPELFKGDVGVYNLFY